MIKDGLGRRQTKTINGSLTEFLYDGVSPVQETSGAAILANILPSLGIDEFLTRTDVVAGTTSNFLTDALGSPIAVTDTGGTVQTEYTYEPFGKTTATGMSSSNPFQYTGRENDGTGLYYYRARYYSPQFQRFISEDPSEFEGGDISLYSYVRNTPTSLIDPTGLKCIRLEKDELLELGPRERRTEERWVNVWPPDIPIPLPDNLWGAQRRRWKLPPSPCAFAKIFTFEIIERVLRLAHFARFYCWDECTGKMYYDSGWIPAGYRDERKVIEENQLPGFRFGIKCAWN